MHRFDVQVGTSMLLSAWNAWFFKERRLVKLGVAAALLLTGVAIDYRQGKLGTISVISLTILGFTLLMLSCVYLAGRRRVIAKGKSIVDGRASYTLTDNAIEAASSLGSVSLAWSSIAELRGYRSLILLRFKGAMYSTIAAHQIPPDALAFLIERCRAAGAKIIDL